MKEFYGLLDPLGFETLVVILGAFIFLICCICIPKKTKKKEPRTWGNYMAGLVLGMTPPTISSTGNINDLQWQNMRRENMGELGCDREKLWYEYKPEELELVMADGTTYDVVDVYSASKEETGRNATKFVYYQKKGEISPSCYGGFTNKGYRTDCVVRPKTKIDWSKPLQVFFGNMWMDVTLIKRGEKKEGHYTVGSPPWNDMVFDYYGKMLFEVGYSMNINAKYPIRNKPDTPTFQATGTTFYNAELIVNNVKLGNVNVTFGKEEKPETAKVGFWNSKEKTHKIGTKYWVKYIDCGNTVEFLETNLLSGKEIKMIGVLDKYVRTNERVYANDKFNLEINQGSFRTIRVRKNDIINKKTWNEYLGLIDKAGNNFHDVIQKHKEAKIITHYV